MALSAANLHWYLSGGSGNTDPNASLGGARSTTEVVNGVLDNVFRDVSSGDTVYGAVTYRCVYFRNEDADPWGLMTGVIYVYSNTPSAGTTIDIGLVSAKNTVAELLADEWGGLPAVSPPAGITFSAPATPATGLALPTPLYTNDYIGIWIRRTVSMGTAYASNDPSTLRVQANVVP